MGLRKLNTTGKRMRTRQSRARTPEKAELRTLARVQTLGHCTRAVLRARNESELASKVAELLVASDLYSDVSLNFSEAATGAPSRRGRPASTSVVPFVLEARGLRLGSLMLTLDRRPADDGELEALQALADDIAYAVDRLRSDGPRPEVMKAEGGLCETTEHAVERLELAARATSDALWDWDLQAKTLWWGEGIETLFQYRRNELERTIESWTSRIHPDERDAVEMGIHRAIGSGATSWSADYRFMRADGSYADVYDRAYIM